MNLLKTFPEVELFFKNDTFSQEELLSFIQEVEKKYSDKKLRKSLSTLLSLKILQFQISHENVQKTQPRIERPRRIQQKVEKVNPFHSLIPTLRSSSVEDISKALEWSISKIIRLLQQNKISKSSEQHLEDSEFDKVREMFNSRLQGIDRMKKNHSSSKSN